MPDRVAHQEARHHQRQPHHQHHQGTAPRHPVQHQKQAREHQRGPISRCKKNTTESAAHTRAPAGYTRPAEYPRAPSAPPSRDRVSRACRRTSQRLPKYPRQEQHQQQPYDLHRLEPQQLFDDNGEAASGAFPLVQFCYRIGDFARIKDTLQLKSMTGVRAYKELARLAGVDEDSLARTSGKLAMASDSMYSAALGTLELSLYEQMHLFNMLYNNNLIIRPADHPSLVLASVVLDGDTVALNNTVSRIHPFADINNLRPTWLGLHKRLISNPGDGLTIYDIPAPEADSGGDRTMLTDRVFHREVLMLREPPSNFAKSGTSDDIIKPFDAPPTTTRRTNYGLWNAVIRIDLSALAGEGAPDVRDVTVACIGECSDKFTGPRDGKTLHRFLTAALLKKAGIRCPNGFFSRYESYLRHVTPSVENCGLKAETASSPPPAIDKRGD